MTNSITMMQIEQLNRMVPSSAQVQNCAAGPDILLFHGVTRCRHDFAPILAVLTSLGNVIGVDHFGHGNSPRLTSYHVIDYAKVTADWVRHHQQEPAVLYGHSLGAMVAAYVAAMHPDLVGALILEDPPFNTLGENISDTPFHSLFNGLKDCLERSDGRVVELAHNIGNIVVTDGRGTASRLSDLRDQAQLRFHASCLLKMDPEVFTHLVDGRWLESFEWEGYLEAIQCPTLLLAADWHSGGMMPIELVSFVEGLIQDCTTVRMRDVGHQMHWQNSTGVGNAICAFMASQITD